MKPLELRRENEPQYRGGSARFDLGRLQHERRGVCHHRDHLLPDVVKVLVFDELLDDADVGEMAVVEPKPVKGWGQPGIQVYTGLPERLGHKQRHVQRDEPARCRHWPDAR